MWSCSWSCSTSRKDSLVLPVVIPDISYVASPVQEDTSSYAENRKEISPLGCHVAPPHRTSPPEIATPAGASTMDNGEENWAKRTVTFIPQTYSAGLWLHAFQFSPKSHIREAMAQCWPRVYEDTTTGKAWSLQVVSGKQQPEKSKMPSQSRGHVKFWKMSRGLPGRGEGWTWKKELGHQAQIGNERQRCKDDLRGSPQFWRNYVIKCDQVMQNNSFENNPKAILFNCVGWRGHV